MNCPGCATPMRHLSLEGKLGAHIDVDLCPACRVIWFDHLKDLQLAPGATLNLFGIISEPSSAAAAPLPPSICCPKCGIHLALTHDMQRSTRFQYWRCPAEHGRLISFIDFLREKDFVRPLTQAQIEDLKQSVKTVNCGNCGGPIDLAKETVCPHCGSALSMLDPSQMARAIDRLKSAQMGVSAPDETAPPDGATTTVHAPNINKLVLTIKQESQSGSSPAMFDIGLRVLADLLKRPH